MNSTLIYGLVIFLILLLVVIGGVIYQKQQAKIPTTPPLVSCQMSNWERIGSCSKECGGGIQKFQRSIIKQGTDCPSNLTKEEACNQDPCMITISKPLGTQLQWPNSNLQLISKVDFPKGTVKQIDLEFDSGMIYISDDKCNGGIKLIATDNLGSRVYESERIKIPSISKRTGQPLQFQKKTFNVNIPVQKEIFGLGTNNFLNFYIQIVDAAFMLFDCVAAVVPKILTIKLQAN
jgi:hypothetical protein